MRYFAVVSFFCLFVFFQHLEEIVTECCLTLGESFKNLKFLSQLIPMVNQNTFKMANRAKSAKAENTSFKRIFYGLFVHLT